MGIYARLLDLEEGKIPIDPFCALLSDQGRGRLNSQQVADAILILSGRAVTAGETSEINTLIATVVGNVQQKLARTADINDALRLAEVGVAYTTVVSLKARLGVT